MQLRGTERALAGAGGGTPARPAATGGGGRRFVLSRAAVSCSILGKMPSRATARVRKAPNLSDDYNDHHHYDHDHYYDDHDDPGSENGLRQCWVCCL